MSYWSPNLSQKSVFGSVLFTSIEQESICLIWSPELLLIFPLQVWVKYLSIKRHMQEGQIQESKDLSHCLQDSQIKQFSFPTRYFFMEVQKKKHLP